MSSPLLHPYRGGSLALPNRIVMAPMTRSRAEDATGVPTPMMATYYAQRATAGLIVSEGIWPHALGKGGPRVPGLTTPAQVSGWRQVTESVHNSGGQIFAQLWHVGRVNHPLNLDGSTPVAPSAVRIESGHARTSQGKLDFVTPRSLTTAEITEQIEAFVSAARNAVTAGFDGVEIHGANGYLIQQFLAENTNRRVDAYGDRTRFAIEVTEAVSAAVGTQRVGLRISPDNPENDIAEETPQQTYRELVDALNPLGLAYLHVVERGRYPAMADLRPRWEGTLIGNHNGPGPTTREAGEKVLSTGRADLMAYGRHFIANPDLPARFADGETLNEVRRNLVYSPGPEGYVDYPALDSASR